MANLELSTVPTETNVDINNDYLWFVDVSETPDAINKVTPASLLGNNLADIRALVDPGSDKILFWDDSADEFAFLTAGSGLSITGTTLSVTVSADPGGSDTQVQFNDGGVLGGSAGLIWDDTKLQITSTAEQLRVRYDSSNHVAFTVSSAGLVTINATGASAGFTFSDDVSVPDEAYDATGWDASLEVPTKNAIRDKIEDILDGVTFTGDIVVPAEAYGVGWNGSNEAPTKNDVYDKIESIALDDSLCIAASDEVTAITTGTSKVTFRMPYAFTLTAVRASVTTAPTGSTIIIDINESGSSVLSTKLSIDASEKTSTTATSAAVISDSSLADDAEMTIDFDQVGSTIAGTGVKVWLIGHKT